MRAIPVLPQNSCKSPCPAWFDLIFVEVVEVSQCRHCTSTLARLCESAALMRLCHEGDETAWLWRCRPTFSGVSEDATTPAGMGLGESPGNGRVEQCRSGGCWVHGVCGVRKNYGERMVCELCPCSRLPAARFGENKYSIKGKERSADKKPPLL